MEKYTINLRFININKFYKGLKNIDLKVKKLNKKETFLEIINKDKYLIAMKKIEKNIQREFAERLYSASPVVC